MPETPRVSTLLRRRQRATAGEGTTRRRAGFAAFSLSSTRKVCKTAAARRCVSRHFPALEARADLERFKGHGALLVGAVDRHAGGLRGDQTSAPRRESCPLGAGSERGPRA